MTPMLQNFKISYIYKNSHVDKLFCIQKRVGYFVIVGVLVQRDDGCGTVIKGGDGGEWSFDGVVLWLGT
jgi:hypothetical protein